MTQAQIINGKEIAAQLRGALGQQVAQFQTDHGVTPGLAVVLVGEDPASQVYVRNKHKQTKAAGMNSFEHKLPDTTGEDALLKLIDELNGDEAVHGILVQLPLPKTIDEDKVLQAIDPAKDVDGFHPVNVGKLSLDVEGLRPCTPVGSVMLAKSVGEDLTGKHVVVVGRSNIVGKPVAQLFLQENCTVTIVHSRTRDIEEITKQADILVAAVGVPQMIKAGWLKQGATVIDVGINRIAGEGGKNRLVGDVDFDDAVSVAGAITPVPGGVGPMTIACLLRNTLLAAYQQKGLPVPDGV